MAKAGLKSFGSPTLSAMDLEPLGNPYDVAPDIGMGNLLGSREALTNEADSVFNQAMSQFSMPEMKRPAPTGPNVLFDPSANKMFVNGSLFDLDDADAAVKSKGFLTGPRQEPPSGNWQRVTPAEYGRYYKSITDPTLSRRFSENVDIGMANLRSLFGAGAVLLGADEYGLGVMERADEVIRKKSPFAGEATDIGFGDEDLGPVEWFVGVLGAQGPMLLETIAAAGVGFVLGSATAGPGLGSAAGTVGGLFGKTAFKKAVKEAAEEYATIKARDGKAAAKAFLKTDKGKTLKRASGAAGAVGLSYTNNFGIASSDVYSELLESGVDVDDFNAKMTALTSAVPYALLDTIPEFVVGAKLFGGLRAGSKGGRLRRGATGAGVGAVLEGTTEAGQEGIIMGATSAYTGREYESDEVLNRLVNSFAAGAAIGGTIGSVTNLKTDKPADLLQGTSTEQEQEQEQETQQDEGPAQGELFGEDTNLGSAPAAQVIRDNPSVLTMSDADFAAYNPNYMPSGLTPEAAAQSQDALSRIGVPQDMRDLGIPNEAVYNEILAIRQQRNPQTELFDSAQFPNFQPDMGQDVNPAQMDLFDQPVIPSQQPGFQMELPFGQQRLMAQPQPVQQEMDLVAPVGTQTDMFSEQSLPLPPAEPIPPTPPQPVDNVVESIEQVAQQQPANLQEQPNLLQQRMQEAAARQREQEAQQQQQAQQAAQEAELRRQEDERIERNNREVENALALQQAQNEIAAYEAEQAGVTQPELPPVAAPVQTNNLPTVPVPPAPPRQLDLFRGQVKAPKPSKAEQKAINKANRLRRKQEREFQKAQEEAARPMTPAEARAAGQGILLTQRGEPSVAALKAAGTVAPATPELTQTTPAEEAVVAQQQEINRLQQQVQELQDAAVQEQSTENVDGSEQARPSEAVRSGNTQERAAAAVVESEKRLREAEDSKAASRPAETEAAVRGSRAEQSVQEDSVQGGTQLDPDSEQAIAEELTYQFDFQEALGELRGIAVSLLDYAYWAAAPSGTSNAADDYRAARATAKAYVDKAFTDPEYFTEAQLKILDEQFVKFATYETDTRSSTQPWFEYAARRGLVERIANPDPKKGIKITGAPYEKMSKAAAKAANVSPARSEDTTDLNEAAAAADGKPTGGGRYFKIDDNTEITQPLDKLRVTAIAKNAIRKLKTKPTVTVVKDQNDLRENHPELFKRAMESRPDGDFEFTPAGGFSVGDQVILFSDNIKTEKQARFIIAHETMGHFGLGAFLGKPQLETVMDNIYQDDSSVRVKADRRMEMYGESKAEAVEEVIANMAADLDAHLIKRIWYAIKDALETMGMEFEDSLARYMLRQSRRNLLQGGSGLVSMQELSKNLESLRTDNTLGRFNVVDDTANAASRALSSHAYTKRAGDTGGLKGLAQTFKKIKDVENIRDFSVWLGSLAENVQSLDNAATRSDGLQQVFNIFQARANRSRRHLATYESMTSYSHQAFNGPTKEELEKAGELLAHAALHKQDMITDEQIRDLSVEVGTDQNGDPIRVSDLVVMENGVAGINRELFEAAVAAGDVTREQFAQGLAVTLGDQEQKVFATETYTPAEAITDNEWRIYTEQRKAVNQAALDVVRSTVEGAIAQKDATISGFKKAYNMSDADTQVMRQIMDRYVELYQRDARQEGGAFQYKSESVEDARTFLREINRALYKKDKVQDFKQSKEDAAKFQGPEFQGIIDGLDSLSDKNYTQSQANRITSAIGNLYLLDVQVANAQFNAKRTIMTSYVPFTRRGDHQIRLTAFNENGDVVQLDEVWKTVLPYYQAQGRADAREIAANLDSEFGDREFKIMDANGVEQTVTFRAVAEKSRKGSVLGQQFSLNDFVNTLARLDVNINPQERERIVEALTAQTQRARRSLQRAGVRGWDRDVIRSTSEYLEMQGHIAGQAFYRHRLNNIMLTDSFWRGDYKRVQDLFAETQRTDLSPEKLRQAQTEYDKYAYMYQYMAGDGMPQAVNRKTGKPMKNLGRGEDYRGTALGLQQWFADAANINNSTEDLLSGETGSQIKMWTVIAQLGGNLATAFINMASMATHSIPYLGTYNEARGFGGGFGLRKSAFEIQRAAFQMGRPAMADFTKLRDLINDEAALRKAGLTRDEAIFLTDATQEGVLQAAQANALVGTARGGIHSNKLQAGIKLWMGAFSYTEQLNRRSTALAAFRLHKQRAVAGSPEFTALQQKRNKTPEETEQLQQMEAKMNADATEFARTAVNTSQGEYGMFNRPEMARGNIGQYLFIYKQFSIITIQMMKGLSPKGRIAFVSMLLLASGLKGMPFADDLADLIDTLLQFFGIKKASVEQYLVETIGEFAPDMPFDINLTNIAMRGVLDQIMAGTFSTRLGMGDLIPLTGAFKAGADTGREITNFFGPVYSGIEGAIVTAGNFARYGAQTVGLRDATMTFPEVLRDAPVAGIRALTDAYTYYDSGVITNAQGKVIDPSASTADILFRAAGFYPSIATKENDAVRLTKQMAAYAKQLHAGYKDAYVKAYIEKDFSRMLDVRQMVMEWNLIHRGTEFELTDFRQKADRAAKAASMPTAQRYLKTAPKNVREGMRELLDIYGLNDEKL